MSVLPDRPSELILLALSDLEAVEKMPGYKVDMETWHHYYPSESSCSVSTPVCHVCFAGAVMANTLKVPITDCVHPEDSMWLDEDTTLKLLALNSFREGLIYQGLERMSIHVTSAMRGKFGHSFACMPQYRLEPALFKSEMTRMAAALKEVGL
jgi:hypothetical protein